jgi:hypothetical protein
MKFSGSIKNNIKTTTAAINRRRPSALYQAVMKGGGLVKTEAQHRLKTQKFASSLKVVGKNANNPEAHVGIKRKSKYWFAKFEESGTKKHTIKPKKAKFLSFAVAKGRIEMVVVKRKKQKIETHNYYQSKSGANTLEVSESANWIKTKQVNHPGMKSSPFLKPAYESKKEEIKGVLADAVLKVMAHAAKENNNG